MAEFSVKQKKEKDGLLLQVTGSLTIEWAADMREALLAAFSVGDSITVDLTQVEGIDVSGLQLLCAACRTSHAQEKQLVVLGSTQPNVEHCAALAGFYRHVGCGHNVTKTCVWVGGQ